MNKVSLILAVLILSTQAHAMDLPFDNMNGFPSNKIKIDYSGFTEPVEPVNNNRFSLQIPLYYGANDILNMSLRGSNLTVPKGIEIPGSTLIEVPESLATAELGLQYTHKMDGERTIGGSVSYGSASDRMFSSNESITLGASLFYSFPSENNDRWIWALFYTNNSPVFRNIPIPAVAYYFKRSTVLGAVGVPFIFLRYTPFEAPWAFTLFDLVTIVKAEVSYGPPISSYFVGFDWNQQTWLRHDVQDTDNKLYFDEKKVFVGTRFLLAKMIFTELDVGQSFDRSFYEGQGLGKKETGTAFLPSSWFAAWNLKFEY